MPRIAGTIALWLLTTLLSTPLWAEPTPGPPAWEDGESAYLEMMRQAPSPVEQPKAQPSNTDDATPALAAAAAPPRTDTSVTPALHNEPAIAVPESAPKPDSRRLAPPSRKRANDRNSHAADDESNPARGASRRIADFGMPLGSLHIILTGLAVAIGAFLVFAWALRRGGRAMGGRRGNLPADVVSVLGRVPLAARQFAELLRVGNKLVLVSLTPTGAETLTEVTDPVEVDRLVGLCQQHDPHSTSQAFEQVFRQLSGEAAPGGFLGNESLSTSLASPAAAYRAHRGAARG
jgi:flagellar biogenesis protein FliO